MAVNEPSSSSKRLRRPSMAHIGSGPRSAAGPRASMASNPRLSLASNPRHSLVSNPRNSLVSNPRHSMIPGISGASLARSTPLSRRQNNTPGFSARRQPPQQQPHVPMAPFGNGNSNAAVAGLGPSGSGVMAGSLTEMMNASIQRTTQSRKSSVLPISSNGSQRFPNNNNSGPPGALPTSSAQRNSSRMSSFGVSTPVPSSAGSASTPASASSSHELILSFRDKDQIAKTAQAVHDYLQNYNFPGETGHPLTLKSLRAPTQKDFVLIFKWLYTRMDPGYKFAKSIEHEVYFLLKTLNYPYLETINKSQISAVGGQSWPAFLNMLLWLVELNTTMDVFNKREYPGAELAGPNIVDQLLFKHTSRAYMAYVLEGVEDNQQFQADLEEEYSGYVGSINASLQEIQESNKELEDKVQELSKKPLAKQHLQEKIKMLTADIKNFQAYAERMEAAKEKKARAIKELEESVKTSEADLKRIQAEKAQIQAQIASQSLKPADIDKMQLERQKIATSLDIHKDRLEEMEKIQTEKDQEAQEALQLLETTMNEYIKACYSLKMDRSKTLSEAMKKDPTLFSIDIPSSLPANAGELNTSIESKINTQIKPLLYEYRKEVSERTHQAQDEYIRIQEKLDSLNEQIVEKRDLLESLQAKYNATSNKADVLTQTMSMEMTAANTEIEKMELKIQELTRDMSTGLTQLQKQNKDLSQEHDTLKRQVTLTRERMEAEAERMLSDVISFKSYTQQALESYENFVAEEYRAIESIQDQNDS